MRYVKSSSIVAPDKDFETLRDPQQEYFGSVPFLSSASFPFQHGRQKDCSFGRINSLQSF